MVRIGHRETLASPIGKNAYTKATATRLFAPSTETEFEDWRARKSSNFQKLEDYSDVALMREGRKTRGAIDSGIGI